MTILISLMALAVDLGNVYYTQRQLQTLVDAAAMAGALEIDTCAGTAKCGQMTTAANYAFTTENSAPAGVTLTINNPPSALGASDPNSGDIHYVEAVVSENVPTYFARIFHTTTFLVSARAEAGKYVSSSSASVITNNLTLNGGASITDAAGYTGGIYDGGNDMENSGATVNVGSYNVQGTVTNNGGSYTPSPTKGAALSPEDPYASRTAPTQPATSSSNGKSPSADTTLYPGTYSSLNLNGSGYTLTLSKGLYYFTTGINVPSITIDGTAGVTLYFAGSAQLNMNSSSTMNITAPTAAQIAADSTDYAGCTASCAGMAIWQSSTDSSEMNLDTNSSSTITGSVYVPDATLQFNSNSTLTCTGTIYASAISVDAGASLIIKNGTGGGGGGNGGSPTIALAE
jgi:Flp pilus assembly protein TadG